MLLFVMKTALEQHNFVELSGKVIELKGLVKALEHNRINDKARKKHVLQNSKFA